MTDEAAPYPPPASARAGGPHPPPPGGAVPPPAGPPPSGYDPGAPPPPGAAGFTSRYGLVRPRADRYLAGVCAAIGRATNTDPVLWRVVLAVLGFFGGIGILVYVAAWLIIPGEGDTASPVESMLGRGRSSMSPVTVIVLSILVAVSFGFIVTDAFRAVLLGAAILIGGALLLNRDARAPAPGPATVPAGVPPFGPQMGPQVGPPFGPQTGPPFGPQTGPATASMGMSAPLPGPVPPVSYPAPDLFPPTHPLPLVGPVPPPGLPQPADSGPTAYRPAFAPHGPYAGPYPPAFGPVSPPAKPPKPPRERSPLGAATFSMIFVALGVVAVLDLAQVIEVGASAYFAAALVTIALGLLVGSWFGRARWLIALGLVASAALGIATLAESYDRVRGIGDDVTWAPENHAALADRYENKFGDAVLDLRAVTFPDKETQVTVAVSFGHTTVVVPPNVDVITLADVSAGEATVFGERTSGVDGQTRESTDLGPDGAGGGKLRLYVHVNAGDLEVTR